MRDQAEKRLGSSAPWVGAVATTLQLDRAEPTPAGRSASARYLPWLQAAPPQGCFANLEAVGRHVEAHDVERVHRQLGRRRRVRDLHGKVESTSCGRVPRLAPTPGSRGLALGGGG